MSSTTHPRPAPASQQRRWLRPHFESLHVQMALGSALVALMAVVVVTLGSLVGVSVSQRNQARAELAAEVSQVASVLGKGDSIAGAQRSFDFATPTATQGQKRPAGSTLTPTTIFTIWVMDASGHVTLYTPPLTTESMRAAILRDEPAVTVALRRALSGQAGEDDLPGAPSGLAALFSSPPERLYAAVPIYRGGGSRGAIVG